MDYTHYNPVKHGLVSRPRAWPYSSFHRYVRLGIYPIDWSCLPAQQHRTPFDDIAPSAME